MGFVCKNLNVYHCCMIILFILTVRPIICPLLAANQLEVEAESSGDLRSNRNSCNSNQFYFSSESRCTNCSELVNFFLNYPAWLASTSETTITNNQQNNTNQPLTNNLESHRANSNTQNNIQTSSRPRPPGVILNPDSIRLTNDHGNNLENSKPHKGPTGLPNRDILSKLIITTSPSPETEDDFIGSGTGNEYEVGFDESLGTLNGEISHDHQSNHLMMPGQYNGDLNDNGIGYTEPNADADGQSSQTDASSSASNLNDMINNKGTMRRKQQQKQSASNYFGSGNYQNTDNLISQYWRQSSFIGSELLDAVDQCRKYQNVSACQFWSNLCVITMYSYTDRTLASNNNVNNRILNLAESSRVTSTMLKAANRARTRVINANLNHPASMVSNTNAKLPREVASGLTLREDNDNRRDYDYLDGKERSWQQCTLATLNQNQANSLICNSLRSWHRSNQKQVDVQNIYALDDPLNKFGTQFSYKLNQVIQLLAYKYSFDGQLIGIEQFGIDDMSRFCLLLNGDNNKLNDNNINDINNNNLDNDKIDMRRADYIKLGKNLGFNCRFSNSRGIRNLNETKFYDLYLAYPSNGATFVRRVPILLKNLIYNGNQVNRLEFAHDSTRYKMVYRFFTQSVLNFDNPSVHHEPHDTAQDLSVENNNRIRSSQTPRAASAYASRRQNYGLDDDHHYDILIYAKTAHLELSFKRQDNKGASLAYIILKLDYGFSPRPGNMQVQHNETSSTSYNGEFTTKQTTKQLRSHEYSSILQSDIKIQHKLVDMSSYKKDLDLVLTITSLISTIWSLIVLYDKQRCYGIFKLNLRWFFRFLMISCDTLGFVFMFINVTYLSYLFMMQKFQTTNIYILSVANELEHAILLNFQLALVFKLISLLYKLNDTLNSDIFFIDWEKPKMLTSNELTGHGLPVIDSKQAFAGVAATDNKQKSAFVANFLSNNLSNLHALPGSQSSFWRPYTIVNRWLQMQTLLRQNRTIHLMVLTCLVELTRMQNWATCDDNLNSLWPNNDPDDGKEQTINDIRWPPQMQPQESQAFRALILMFAYAFLSICQLVYNKFIYEAIFKNTIEEFVDLCSIANVSVFCMLYRQTGYYIHGRNANGSGDCSIAEVNSLLERESRNICSRRGLAPNSDEQTFTMSLPRIINDHYRKLLQDKNLVQQQHQSAQANFLRLAFQYDHQMDGGKQLQSNSLQLSNDVLKLMARFRAINMFLINFIQHNYRDIDYTIREKQKSECFIMDSTCDEESSTINDLSLMSNNFRSITSLHRDKSAIIGATFCIDRNNSFTSMFLIGLELDLIFVELLMFVILDLWLSQPPLLVTASLMWLLHNGFKKLYASYARQNLIYKAQVDEKFLFNQT